MGGRWLKANKAVFVRDLVRDYCKVCAALEDQRRRFNGDGTVSHAVLRDLLGESIRKGVFWRLKDTAHHLFRAAGCPEGEGVELWQYASCRLPDGVARQDAVEAALDWCVGYAFHECVKLKEDAFLQQHYANRYVGMTREVHGAEALLAPLEQLTAQTRESICREIRRILHVLGHGRLLLVRYLAAHADNRHLARLLYSESSLIRGVFGEAWPALLEALYHGDMARMHRLAARAFWEGGRPREGLAVLDAWAATHPLDDEDERLRLAMSVSPLPPDGERDI